MTIVLLFSTEWVKGDEVFVWMENGKQPLVTNKMTFGFCHFSPYATSYILVSKKKISSVFNGQN
jgi:hypothetical protein